jgi:hypothetical protein
MADGARPQTSVPLPAGLIAGLGDASAAIKMARKEIKELQRDITAAVRKGEQVSPDLARRLDQAQKLEASLATGIKRQKEVQQGIQRTTADAQALKFLIGAQAFRQILAGGLPDARALSAMVFASGEHIQKLATRAFGTDSKITSLAKGFVRVAPFVGEAVASIIEAVDRVKEENQETRRMVTEFQAGKFSQVEQDLYFRIQQANERKLFGENPNAVFQNIIQISNLIANADDDTMRKVVRPALEKELENLDTAKFLGSKFWQHSVEENIDGKIMDRIKRDRDVIENELMGPTFQNRLADAMDTKARELGYYQAGLAFTPEQQAYIKRQVIGESVQKLTNAQRTELLGLLKQNAEAQGKKFDPMLKTLAHLQREASDKFKETEIKKMQQINFQNARRRVALNGRIGE